MEKIEFLAQQLEQNTWTLHQVSEITGLTELELKDVVKLSGMPVRGFHDLLLFTESQIEYILTQVAKLDLL